uniref:Replication stress response regulator SDE2 n=1 Tax=Takifugu rubripes TaxID=31033 RepID=H2U578_TAKRU
MEVFVRTSMFSFANWSFTDDSVVREVLDRFVQKQGGGSSNDFYVVQNGRLSNLDEPLQRGAIYHLEPRLCGGKGGFGSMLRALGAQIEKTTNREACRDLSGRRLRDVNHEKEMADWLKKQAEREAEKEQRQVERLQRKLREPEHRFSDMEFQQQCHELSERLEDSVIKGLQVSSPGQMKAGHSSTTKRHNLSQSKEPHAKKMMSELWTGLEELQSSEEDDSNEDDYVSFSHISTDYIATEREQISRLDLATVTSVEHLEILGLDVLKDELRCRGLKCGGTLTERAARLFSIRGLTPEQINPALLAKPTKAKKK